MRSFSCRRKRSLRKDSKSNDKSNNDGKRVLFLGKVFFWSILFVAQCFLVSMCRDAATQYYGIENSRSSSSSNNNNHSNGNKKGIERIARGVSKRERILEQFGGGTAKQQQQQRQQVQKPQQQQRQKNPPRYARSNSNNNNNHGTTGSDVNSHNNNSNSNLDRFLGREPPQELPDGTFNGYPIYKLQRKDHGGGSNTKKNIKNNDLYSQFQCVGETWKTPLHHTRSRTNHERSWMYRSCRFQVMCFDTSTREYVIFLDPKRHVASRDDHHYHHHSESDGTAEKIPHPSRHIQKILDQQHKKVNLEKKELLDANHPRNTTTEFKHPSFFDDTSTVYRNHTVLVDSNGEVVVGDTEKGIQYGVSIGSINGKWGEIPGTVVKWFPKVLWGPVPGSNKDDGDDNDYEVYTLPSTVVLIPFHSLSAENPGHLLWDDFLPMYTLMDMFGFLKKNNYTHSTNADDTDEPFDLLPIRYVLPGLERGMWAGCEWTNEKRAACNYMLHKFGTLMGMRRSYLGYYDEDPESSTNTSKPLPASKLPAIPITSNKNTVLRLVEDGMPLPENLRTNENGKANADNTNQKKKRKRKKRLICARNSMAGFGAINDHGDGTRGHGWEETDFFVSHNSGRGGQFWEFRNYLIENLFAFLPKKKAPMVLLPTPDRESSVALRQAQMESFPPSSVTDVGPREPLLVLFSSYSSKRRGGSMIKESAHFRDLIAQRGGSSASLYGAGTNLAAEFSELEIVVEVHTFSKFSLEEQIQMASRAAIIVTPCGGGAITASFLPRGGSLLLSYYETGGIKSNKKTGLPARLDWDFFNNASYLHVNWVPFRETVRSTWSNGRPTDGAGFKNQNEANGELMLAELRRIHRERRMHDPDQHQQ